MKRVCECANARGMVALKDADLADSAALSPGFSTVFEEAHI